MPSADPTRVIALRDLRYLGGHPRAPSELDRVDMLFDQAGVHFERKNAILGSIAWDRVSSLTADAEYSSARMTVPRVWLLGVLAALFKKRERRVLLRLADDSGAWVFEVDGIRLDQLRSGLRKVWARYKT